MRRLAEDCCWWMACVAVWLLTLSSVGLAESLIAAGCALPCAVLAVRARRAVEGSWPPEPAVARWLLPLPVAVVADSARVLARATGVLVGRRVPFGELRSVPLRRGPGGRWNTRQAAATVLVTATPGTVVTDIDDDSGRMQVHGLDSGSPSMEDVVAR